MVLPKKPRLASLLYGELAHEVLARDNNHLGILRRAHVSARIARTPRLYVATADAVHKIWIHVRFN
jgi:hypothetical protein